MANYLLKYGALSFPGSFAIAADELEHVVPVQKLARWDGARSIRGSLGPRRVTVQGGLVGLQSPIGGVSIRSTLDSFRTAVLANAPANFYVGRDDRYLRNPQLTDIREIWTPTGFSAQTGERIVNVECEFIANDPFYYSTVQTSDTWSPTASGQSRVIATPSMTAYALPVLSITVGGAGAQTIAYTITNSTSGKSFTLTGAVTGGNVIVVDCLQQQVTIGGVDKMSLFNGIFIALTNGNNTITESYGATSITQIVTAYRARFY